MSETMIAVPATVKDWELDPVDRCGFRDPDDISRWLEKQTAYAEQLTRCKNCPLLGRGAICAAELVLPDFAASTMLMKNCEMALAKGDPKPNHGSQELRVRPMGLGNRSVTKI